MDLSVIIVSYNVRYFVEQALLSVFASRRNFELEVFVVDNASTDGSAEYVAARFPAQRYPGLHVIASQENLGFGRANNLALERARGRYVLFLNPDTLLGEDVLQRSYDYAEQHPDLGAMGTMMLADTGRFARESRRGVTTPWVSFCKICGLTALFPRSRRFGAYYMGHLDPSLPAAIEIVSGAYLWARREPVAALGGFDRRFFMYGEDIDLSYRLLLAGRTNYYVPNAIIHYKGESTDHHSWHYVYNFHRAMLLFYRKHFRRSRPVLTALVRFGIFLHTHIVLAQRRWDRLWHRTPSPQPACMLYVGRHAAAMSRLAARYGLQVDVVEGDEQSLPAATLPAQAVRGRHVHVVYDMENFSRAYVIEAFRLSAHQFRLGTFYPAEGLLVTSGNTYQHKE